MKRLALTFLCLCAIIIILTSRQAVNDGVVEGIKLSIYSVIPSLLPFMLITNIMLRYNLCRYISYIFYPLLSKIYSVSKNGCFAIIIGFTCGFPMGAKVIGDLYRQNRISYSESCYLITFCNNTSITFLLNYILFTCFRQSLSLYQAILLVYLPPLFTGIINRFLLKPCSREISNYPAIDKESNPILSTVKSISVLSMYVICFTVLSKWILTLEWIPYNIQKIMMCFTEITSGAHFVCAHNTLTPYHLFLVIIATIFGGFSIMFQSFSCLPTGKLKFYYIIGKLEAMLIGAFLFFVIFFVL